MDDDRLYPEFMVLAHLCREEKEPYSTVKRRQELGELDLHLVDGRIMVRTTEALALIEKIRIVRRAKRPRYPQGPDLFGDKSAA